MIRGMARYVKSLFESTATVLLRFLATDSSRKSAYHFKIPENCYNPYFADNTFLKGLQMSVPYTIIATTKFQSFYWALQESPVGDVIDVGVLRGGSSIFFAKCLQHGRKVYSVDHWSEKKSDKKNSLLKYSKQADLRIFQSATRDLGLIKRVIVCDEPFLTFCKNHKNLDKSISIIHFDIYDEKVFDKTISSMLQWLPRGGCILVGGYGALALPKLSEAVNQAAQRFRDVSRFVHDKNGYGIFIKIA
jgi:predicted O-methyltransferase YrrM